MTTLRQELYTTNAVTHVNAFNKIDGYYYETSEHKLMKIIKDLFKGYPHPIMVLHHDNREICFTNLPASSEEKLIGQRFDDTVELVEEEISREPVAYFNKQWFCVEERPFQSDEENYILIIFSNRQEVPDEETLASWKNMIAVMLHRFRSPLTGIAGYVDMLAEYDENPDKDKYFTLINKGINHLYDMMDELEILYNIEPGYLEDETASIEAGKLFHNLLLDYPADIREQINLKSIKPGVKFHTNPSDLKHILNILIQNGLEHNPDGDLSVSVPSEHLIQISNKGQTIPDHIAQNIFSPFITDKANGLGIGLTIALLYINQLGGTIFLSKNNAAEGVTFSICLPK
ncbi:HAMP domain-containing sensor histidine kinase [Gracilimonas sp.]|uniref:sensor histidine kinase n=1 Tax=Gracilimonas sp. TaxID=1974203 RepID=UPI0032EBD6B1